MIVKVVFLEILSMMVIWYWMVVNGDILDNIWLVIMFGKFIIFILIIELIVGKIVELKVFWMSGVVVFFGVVLSISVFLIWFFCDFILFKNVFVLREILVMVFLINIFVIGMIYCGVYYGLCLIIIKINSRSGLIDLVIMERVVICFNFLDIGMLICL